MGAKNKIHSSNLLLNSYLFSTTLYFGYLFGCVPLESCKFKQLQTFNDDEQIIPSTKNNRQSRPLLSKTYSFFALFVISFFSLEYFFSNLNDLYAELPESQYLLYTVTSYIFFICDASRRIFFLYRYQCLANIFRQITSLNIISPCTRLHESVKSCRTFYYVMCINFIAGALRNVFSLLYFAVLPSYAKVTPVKSIFFDTNSTLLPWFENISSFCSGFGSLASKLVARAFILAFGDYLIEKYQQVIAEFKELVQKGHFEGEEAKHKSDDKTDSDKLFIKVKQKTSCWKIYTKKFQLLQDVFQFYSSFVGPLVLICSVESVVFGIFNLYRLNVEWTKHNMWQVVTLVYGSLDQILNLYLMVLMGQNFKDAMRKGKEEVKGLLLQILTQGSTNKESSLDKTKAIKLMSDSILKWNWKLTAAGLFKVDFGLLPGIAGNVMTYIMFFFQLKISEETSELKKGNNTTRILIEL